MKFTYTYRSSDGQRHTDAITAESRDAAFAALRQRGIKPIKVEAEDGSRANGEEAGAGRRAPRRRAQALALAGLALAGGAWLWFGRAGERSPRMRRHNADTAAAFKALEDAADAVRRQCGTALDALDLDLTENYALIERTADIAFLYDEINKARGVVEWARSQAKAIFRDIHATFPASRANERLDAQALYGALMAYVDGNDERMMRLESALMLLDRNRDKWRCVKGRLAFSDAALEDEYRFFKVEPDADAARWQRDFGEAVGERNDAQEPAEQTGGAK